VPNQNSGHPEDDDPAISGEQVTESRESDVDDRPVLGGTGNWRT
jgi:hypothetical protein